jgi:Carboxypeptidase regulatory-like domain
LLRVAALSLLCISTHAHTFRGNLAGVVTDASDAAIANAAVNLDSPANGLKRATSSTTNGAFLIAELPVGAYMLDCAAGIRGQEGR